jgi:SAM-dependent methyltransferase
MPAGARDAWADSGDSGVETFQSGTEMAALLRRVAARYENAGRYGRTYVAMKLRQDPVHADIISLAARENLGDVVDIGCGRGQLAVALLEAGVAKSVVGLDWNASHLSQGQDAAAGLAFKTMLQDASSAQQIPDCDTVIMVDVLYQLRTEAQFALLRAAARAARERILIRTADPERGARSAFTRCLEILGQRILPNSGAHVNALRIATIGEKLAAEKFALAVAPCWRGTPFANVLLVARRQPAPDQPPAC